MASLFEAADEAVSHSEEVQQLLRGERVALLPPGWQAYVGTQALLLLGIGGLVAGLMGPATRALPRPHDILAVIGGAYLMVLLVAVPAGMVAFGRSRGHRYMCRATTVLLISTIVVAALALTTNGSNLERFGPWVALGASALAHRLVRGPLYALGAAFFRAKRSLRLEHQRKRDEVLRRQK